MMKSVKEISVESKILKRLQKNPKCLELLHYLINDAELQEMQDYANNVSIKRLGYNDHGPVHMRQVTANAIKMLNILHESGIKTSLEAEEIGCFEDSMCAVIMAGLMHDLGMMIGRQGHEDMSVTLAKPIIERAVMHVFPDNLHRRTITQIAKRGRDYEQSISIEYLSGLNERYDEWIGSYTGRLITIDVDDLDFLNRPEDFALITDRIDAELYGLF